MEIERASQMEIEVVSFDKKQSLVGGWIFGMSTYVSFDQKQGKENLLK